MKYKITQSILTAKLKNYIYKKFSRHALSIMGTDGLASAPAVFKIKDNDLDIGLCIVQLFWGNLHIKYLLIHEEYRGRGIGKRLMLHAMDFGKKQGCKFAFVETMSFQAPQFYQKLGFKVELKRDGYTGGSSFYYLRIDL